MIDTSETYIKMCEKAEEIQQHSPRRDWLDIEFLVAPFCSPDGNFFMRKIAEERIYIWLPRQDQLQEMVRHTCPLDLFNQFYRWCDLTDIGAVDSSFEQLWLAFVMQQKYSKTWSVEKEEWIQEIRING